MKTVSYHFKDSSHEKAFANSISARKVELVAKCGRCNEVRQIRDGEIVWVRHQGSGLVVGLTAIRMSVAGMSTTICRVIVASIGDHGVTSSATVLMLPAPVVDHVVGGQLEWHDRVDQTADWSSHRVALATSEDEGRQWEQGDYDADCRCSTCPLTDSPRDEEWAFKKEGREDEEVECEKELKDGHYVGQLAEEKDPLQRLHENAILDDVL